MLYTNKECFGHGKTGGVCGKVPSAGSFERAQARLTRDVCRGLISQHYQIEWCCGRFHSHSRVAEHVLVLWPSERLEPMTITQHPLPHPLVGPSTVIIEVIR